MPEEDVIHQTNMTAKAQDFFSKKQEELRKDDKNRDDIHLWPLENLPPIRSVPAVS